MWNDDSRIIVIQNSLNEAQQHFPCICPICQSQSAHIYIHQNSKDHCGIWTWCSSCKVYSHMSGKAPKWWKNPAFVDENQLCSEPEYLDKIADKIDNWVSSIIPDKITKYSSQFVMENQFSVQLVEELQGIPAGSYGTLVVKDDFKNISINFIDESGKDTNLDITPEKAESVFKVI